MNYKRLWIFVLLICLVITFASGCSKETETTQDGQEVFELVVAGQDPEGHPNTIALNTLKDRLEAETEGRIKMTIYPAGQLGDHHV